MKPSSIYSTARILVLGMVAGIAPLNAALAQGYSDDMRSDSPSSMPPSSDEGTTTVNPPEATTTPGQDQTSPSYQQQMSQPRGARGPIRRGDINPDNLRATDRYVEGLPEYQKQLDTIFHAD